MARPELNISKLVKAYKSCNNTSKEEIINRATSEILALTSIPSEVKIE